ncbi:MAG TPA: multiheme c-type cytochrome [Isosphaeraceae bacterium]
MKSINRHLAWRMALVSVAWCAVASPAAGSSPAAARGESAWGVTRQWQGAGSCASGACHNAGGARGAARLDVRSPTKLSEYTHWVKFDPHAKAFGILYADRSRRIEQALRGLKSVREAHPERDGLCLNCHVHQNFERSQHVGDFALDDGVSCEGCHGAAQDWLQPHTQAGWRSLSDARKAALGMVPTKDLVERARVCVTCHVGSEVPDPVHGLVDVNHDLIAAGHPRMNFEYASFLAIYPRHWDIYEEKARTPDLEARAWAIGQVVTGQQALDLLGARARRFAGTTDGPEVRRVAEARARAGQTGGWPEFSEYSCFACHHDVRGRAVAGLGGRPGTPPWGTWYFPFLESGAFPAETSLVRSDLEALRREMEKPYPDPTRVAAGARRAARNLDGLLRDLQGPRLDPGRLRGLMASLARAPEPADRSTWDHAAQLYLALAALYHAQTDLAPYQVDPRWRSTLQAMVEELRYPPRRDSPYPYRPPTSFHQVLQLLGQ